MSYGLQAYAVDLDELKKAIGSGDAVLAKRLSKQFAADLRSIDTIDFDGEGLAKTADLLRRLIVDGAPDADEEDEEAPGYKWGYALEMLCRGIGDWMPPSAFSGMGSEYFDTVDEGLRVAKVKRKVASVVFRGSPVALPFIEDFPAIGWMSATDAAAWKGDLAALLGGARVPSSKPKSKGKAEPPEGFSGRVKGTQLVVVTGGKKKITKFATKAEAQKALIAALTKSNAGAADAASPEKPWVHPEAEPGLRELLRWTEAAVAKKRGLVLFYY